MMAKAKKIIYKGPFYKEGIKYQGQLYRPKEMSQEEIEDFIAIYPPAAEWFETKQSGGSDSEQ